MIAAALAEVDATLDLASCFAALGRDAAGGAGPAGLFDEEAIARIVERARAGEPAPARRSTCSTWTGCSAPCAACSAPTPMPRM